MKTSNMMLGLLIVQIILVGLIAYDVSTIKGELLGITAPGGADNAPAPTGVREAPSPSVDMKDLIDDDEPMKGSKDAPVTIIEWSDFQCPFCARFYTQTLPLIEEEYVKSGKVRIIYKDFPLSMHPQAQKSAEAAECAQDQGKFWEMHDLLFDNQRSLSVDNYKKWAADLGLNTAEFNQCLDSGKHRAEVLEDMEQGKAAGVTGTPGFLVNGKLVVGAQPFSAFQAAIEAELA